MNSHLTPDSGELTLLHLFSEWGPRILQNSLVVNIKIKVYERFHPNEGRIYKEIFMFVIDITGILSDITFKKCVLKIGASTSSIQDDSVSQA